LSFVFFALMLFPSLNVIRQAAAAAIIFYALYFAYERKWVIYIALIIVASIFHLSALLLVFMIPYFFINFKKDLYLLLYLV
ncbi:EpsG family protein, partial [Salmonella sp. ZJHZ21_0024]|uniref:EpsG family protein n=1 Tax=Salmonella sp. ZJHZ21_0024 TaxID=3159610 RepID=UPI0039812371